MFNVWTFAWELQLFEIYTLQHVNQAHFGWWMKNGRCKGLGRKLSRVEAERQPNERKGTVNQATAMVKMA